MDINESFDNVKPLDVTEYFFLTEVLHLRTRNAGLRGGTHIHTHAYYKKGSISEKYN
jgi:hypothetical protein